MIHRISNYSAILTSRDMEDGMAAEATYRPLMEVVCCSNNDIYDVSRKMKLILRAGVRPVVVVFEPEEVRNLEYGTID